MKSLNQRNLKMDKLLVEYQPALTRLLVSKLPAHGTIQSVEGNKSTIIKDDSNLVQLLYSFL